MSKNGQESETDAQPKSPQQGAEDMTTLIGELQQLTDTLRHMLDIAAKDQQEMRIVLSLLVRKGVVSREEINRARQEAGLEYRSAGSFAKVHRHSATAQR